jgi:lysophospholipase L1-like esterase
VKIGLRIGILVSVAAAASACAESTPTTPSPTAPVHYTAIGASDALGVGSSQVCLPFVACSTGLGYVQVIARRIDEDGRDVTLTNLGVPGAVLSPEIEDLGNSLGRGIPINMLQREAPFVPATATIVTIFAGGNDANTIAAAVSAGRGGNNPAAYAQGLITRFGDDLVAMANVIRGRAANVRIIAMNLPNMAAMPFVAGASSSEKQGLQTIAVGLSAEINQLRSIGVEVVDLMCNPTIYSAGFTSSDGFHPSDAGYAALADLLLPVVNGASAGTPPADCAQMRVY